METNLSESLIPVPHKDDLNPTDFVRMALSHIKLIGTVTLFFILAALAYAFFWPRTYEAATTVKVPDSSQTAMGMLLEISPNPKSGDPLETYSEICQSQNVAGRVVLALKLAGDPEYKDLTNQELIESLSKRVSISNVKKSNLLSIQARSHNPQLASELANAWAQAFIEVNLDLSHKGAVSKRKFLEEQVTQLKARLDNPNLRLDEESKADEVIYNVLLQKLQEAHIEENVDASGIVVVDSAVKPEKPISPQKLRAVLLALLLGLATGFQLAFLLERARDRVKSEEVLKRATGLPNYAVVPDFREDYPGGLGPPSPKERFSPKSLIQNPVFEFAYYRESFKVLRTNLTFARADKPLKAMAVLSPSPEEGKTLVNANLAISLALDGKKTLLIDADFRKSSVRKIFGLENGSETGLPVALTGQGDWEDMIRPSGVENLDLLPNTVTPPNPAELLGSEAFRKLLVEIKKKYDYIVFDGAPVLPVTDSVVLSTHLDGVVLLARWDKTRSSEVARAMEHLRAVGAPILGTIMNYVRIKQGLYGYGYGYGGYGNYGYGRESHSKEKIEIGKS